MKKIANISDATSGILAKIVNFSGQTWLETWSFREAFEAKGWSGYHGWRVNELSLVMQAIRDLADAFPFCQRKKKTGRPPIEERDLLICFLVQDFFKFTDARTEGFLLWAQDLFGMKSVPDDSVIGRKNRSKRWEHLWKRIHRFVLDLLPEREADIATDATGLSGRKRPWRETPHAQRAVEDWVKINGAIEADRFLILSYDLSKSNVHESQTFEAVWEGLPDNVHPRRSLADTGYTGEENLTVVREAGAIPYHKIRQDARFSAHPETNYQKQVYSAIRFPGRFAEYYGIRNHSETAFSIMTECFGHRLRCRTPRALRNEAQRKINALNLRMILAPAFMMAQGV